MNVETVHIDGIAAPVSRIGLGTWAIGGWMWGGADDAASILTIRGAIEKGINLIDTAPAYGFGRSEEIVGKALEGLRFRALDILQPSLLLGARRDLRLLELGAQAAMRLLNPLLLGGWSRWRAIPAATVAAAMCGAAGSGRRGVYRYTYDGIRSLAGLSARRRTDASVT